MEKTETKNNFENLRNYYPRIIELFAREQFYRNNHLPTEINNLIEIFCLDLNNLNGKLCLANNYYKINGMYLRKRNLIKETKGMTKSGNRFFLEALLKAGDHFYNEFTSSWEKIKKLILFVNKSLSIH